MQIDSIRILNFKSYQNLDVNFSPSVNLFVGGNGSGKTGLLEAVNVAIGGFFGSQEQKMQRVIRFDEIKITGGIREQNATVEAESPTFGIARWSRTINRNTKSNDVKFIRPLLDYGKKIFDAFEIADDVTAAPLIAYYSTQRLFKDAALSKKQKYDAAAGRRNGYLQCLDENAIKSVLDEWLGNAVTRRATKQIKEIEGLDTVLENVEISIREMLIDFLELPPSFSLKIYQDPDFGNELFLNYDYEHNFPLSYYSDGFRNLVYLIIDLVWRASQLNPWMNLSDIASEVKGVVTIDEIDLHLHPRWQAKAISLLQKFFPKVQFFITTHSPTVVANFEKGTLYTIVDNQVSQVNSKYFGKQVNTVLRDVLGATDRHKPTQDAINLFLRRIDEDLPQRELNAQLDQLIELLGFDDVDVQRAIAMIEWKQIEKTDAIH